MNDIFQSLSESDPTATGGEEMDASRRTLLACQKCFEEFSIVCEECELEMSLRDPVVMSNCRDFMHRYSSVFMSRVTLELSWNLGKDKASSNFSLSDVFIIESIKFFHSIDSLKHFQFLPRSLFIGLRENLQTYDQLCKYLSHLLVDRNIVWFNELNELQPRQRGYKLREFYKIVNFQVEKIHKCFYLSDKNDVATKTDLITNTIHTMVFSLAKYVKCLDFANYGEEALLEHILACQEIVKFCFGLKVYPYHGKINNKSATENFGVNVDALLQQWVIALQDSELEGLSTTFLTSADTAAASAVKNTFHTFEDIRVMFFYEKPGMGWLGGKVCQLYLDRVTTWMVAFCDRASATPCEFHRITIRETIRMVVYSYVKGLCDRYKNDKKFMLSEEGSQQLAADLQTVMSWVDEQNVKLIPPTVKNKSEYKGCNDLTMLLRNIRMFVTSDESSLLFCLSEAIQHFGTASSLHLYDLARLCLKIRDDVSNSTRKHVLGLFSTYVDQLQRASLEEYGPLSKSHPRLSGPELLADLFPRVGVYHCSGKKWSLEKLHDSETTARLEIAAMVTDACNISRIRHAGMTKESKEVLRKQRSTFRKKRRSCGVDDLASVGSSDAPDASDDTCSSELWQLLDPSYVEIDSSSSVTPSEVGMGDEEYDRGVFESALDMFSSDDDDDDYQDGIEKEDYELAVERPFVDLHGCTFEELHQTLRPKVFADVVIPPIHFVNSFSVCRVSSTPKSSIIVKGAWCPTDEDYDEEESARRLQQAGSLSLPIMEPLTIRKSLSVVSDVYLEGLNDSAGNTTSDTITTDNDTTDVNNLPLGKDSIMTDSDHLRPEETLQQTPSDDSSSASEQLERSRSGSVAPKKPPKPRRYSRVESEV
mmetsp:Transcript_17609/g.29507  ORF Transcript_17609/g.29507 Transcript_17609/m.29507 type:complete len:876 (-) Transcript_17609:106-2733(-)